MDTDTDTPTAPPLDPALFDRVQAALAAAGPAAAIDQLIEDLRRAEDFNNLFYALLMKKRVELGAPPFPTGPAAELPPATHEAYEQAIREAGRHVGGVYLARGDLPRAWNFFRMLGEPEPVKAALDAADPAPDADVYPLVDMCWQQGLLPRKGFDLVLDRNGVCSAITMVGSSDLSQNPDLRAHCVGRLVRAVHEQLTDRLRADLEQRGSPPPANATIPQLVEGQDELFAEDCYHIDVSHLSSVVQFSLWLPPGPELNMARDLCAYGRRLAPGLKGHGDVPFENNYDDHLVYLNVLTGENVEAGLAHFRAKIDPAAAEGNTYPAEVLVNLLLRLDRPKDALAVARQYLGGAEERNLTCPGVVELARRVGDYQALAAAARAKADPVNFLAGLIAGRNS